MKVTNTQYKLLPNEPTSKLLSTMHGKLPYCMGDIDHEVLIEVYRALLGEGLEVDQVLRHQESLSEDEIFELFSKQNFTAYKIDDSTDHKQLVSVEQAVIDFARAIEKAHGIGV
jgi:predicted transcriptional regulator